MALSASWLVWLFTPTTVTFAPASASLIVPAMLLMFMLLRFAADGRVALERQRDARAHRDRAVPHRGALVDRRARGLAVGQRAVRQHGRACRRGWPAAGLVLPAVLTFMRNSPPSSVTGGWFWFALCGSAQRVLISRMPLRMMVLPKVTAELTAMAQHDRAQETGVERQDVVEAPSRTASCALRFAGVESWKSACPPPL